MINVEWSLDGSPYNCVVVWQTLLERWQGPISLALHAPGTDLTPTLDTIRYLHECTSAPVSEYVTFHVYFPSKHVPKQVPHLDKIFSEHFNCSKPPPWTAIPANTIYKAQKKLLYPVNVGRNIARESAVTHYILPSDIELYPSPGVIPDFLEMIRRQDPPLLRQRPKVFPLSIFELESNMSLPVNKSDLVSLYVCVEGCLPHKFIKVNVMYMFILSFVSVVVLFLILFMWLTLTYYDMYHFYHLYEMGMLLGHILTKYVWKISGLWDKRDTLCSFFTAWDQLFQ